MVKIGELITDLVENFEQYIGATIGNNGWDFIVQGKDVHGLFGEKQFDGYTVDVRGKRDDNGFWKLVAYPPSYIEETVELPLVAVGSVISNFKENFDAYIGAKIKWCDNPGYVVVKGRSKNGMEVWKVSGGHTDSGNQLSNWPIVNADWPIMNQNWQLVEAPTLASYLEEGEALPPIESLPNVTLQREWQVRTYGQIRRIFAIEDGDELEKYIGCWVKYPRENGRIRIDKVFALDIRKGFTGKTEEGHGSTNSREDGWYLSGFELKEYPPIPLASKGESDEAWLKRMKETYGELETELPDNWRENDFEKWKGCWLRHEKYATVCNGDGKGAIRADVNTGSHFTGEVIGGHNAHNGGGKGWKGEDSWWLVGYPDRGFKFVEPSPFEKQYGKLGNKLTKLSPRDYRRCWIKHVYDKGAIRVEDTWKTQREWWLEGRSKDSHNKGPWIFKPNEWVLIAYPDADEPTKKKGKKIIKVSIERGMLTLEDKVRVKALQAIIKSLSGPAAQLREVDRTIKDKVRLARQELRNLLSPGVVMKYACDRVTEESIPLYTDLDYRKRFIETTREALRSERIQRRERGYDPLATRMPGHFVQQYQEKIFKIKKYPEPDKEYVGIELECYAPAKTDLKPILLPWAKYVRIGSDGSIHAEPVHVSYEIRLLIPVLELETVLTPLLKALRQAGTKVNASCGTHVHFDMRHLTLDQVKGAYKNLFHSQNILFGIQPPSRQENNYCRRNDSSEFTGNETERYKAINPCAYHKYTTLELRLHAGTLDDVKLKHWITLCRTIMSGPALIQAKRKVGTFAEHFSLSDNLVSYIKSQMEKYDPEKPIEERKRLELESYAEPIEFGRPFSIPEPEPEEETEDEEAEEEYEEEAV